MTEKSEALRLADAMSLSFPGNLGIDKAAAELRRQHEEIESLKAMPMKYRRMEFNAQLQTENDRLRAQRDRLLEVLKQIEPILARMYGPQAAELPPMQIVRTAIKSVEGE